jgi:hypothetical protein
MILAVLATAIFVVIVCVFVVRFLVREALDALYRLFKLVARQRVIRSEIACASQPSFLSECFS